MTTAKTLKYYKKDWSIPNRKLSGIPLSKKEIKLICAIYTSQPVEYAILAKVREEFLAYAKKDKKMRKDISTATIGNLRDELKLEELRLKNMQEIRERYRIDGENIAESNLSLVREMKRIIRARLIGNEENPLTWVEPKYTDLEAFIKLELYLTGGPTPDKGEGDVIFNLINVYSQRTDEQLRDALNAKVDEFNRIAGRITDIKPEIKQLNQDEDSKSK